MYSRQSRRPQSYRPIQIELTIPLNAHGSVLAGEVEAGKAYLVTNSSDYEVENARPWLFHRHALL